jgi:hypothetical protein
MTTPTTASAAILTDSQLARATEAAGVLIAWSGLGRLTRAQLAEVLASVGASDTWLPAAKSARAQAGRVAELLVGSGLVVRATRAAGQSVTARGFKARWTVGTVDHAQLGDRYGKTIMTIVLGQDDQLTVEAAPGFEERAAYVTAEFGRRVGAEEYDAGDVTSWFRSLLTMRLGAMPLGGCVFVPASRSECAEAIGTALSKIWGTAWMIPGIPVTGSTQLRAGLVHGIEAEVVALVTEIDLLREIDGVRSTAGRVPARQAAARLVACQNLLLRTRSFADLVGPKHVAHVVGMLTAQIALLDSETDATSMRAAEIEEELAREASAN